MKEHPIIFSAKMVRAILDGRKTQTRRVWRKSKRHQNHDVYPVWLGGRFELASDGFCIGETVKCPYGVPGDKLWIRETFQMWADVDGKIVPHYKADYTELPFKMSWRPSIHMPRWASRITLEVVSVRVERVQNISEQDAMAEGVTPKSYVANHLEHIMYRSTFHLLWDSINAKRGFPWSSNPWVWAVEFRQVK